MFPLIRVNCVVILDKSVSFISLYYIWLILIIGHLDTIMLSHLNRIIQSSLVVVSDQLMSSFLSHPSQSHPWLVWLDGMCRLLHPAQEYLLSVSPNLIVASLVYSGITSTIGPHNSKMSFHSFIACHRTGLSHWFQLTLLHCLNQGNWILPFSHPYRSSWTRVDLWQVSSITIMCMICVVQW